MKKALIFLTILYAALIVFMPKTNLWFTLEHYIKKDKIVMEEGSISDRLFWLSIDNTSFIYDGLKSADIESIKLYPFAFYNKVIVKNITASNEIKNIFNFKADELSLQYSIRDINHVFIKSYGDFGEVEGSIDIKEKKINLKLAPSKAFEKNKFLLQTFKKTKDGYIYESSFK